MTRKASGVQEDWIAPDPGTWNFDGPPHNHIVWSGPGQRVCFLTSDGPTTENAQLISAAPDLLAALEDALEYLQHHLPEQALTSHRAAIAKARGK